MVLMSITSMNTQSVKAAIFSVYQLEPEAWNEFEQALTLRKLYKGEMLWSIGDVCGQVIFINSGLIRSFAETEDKETTYQFFFENRLLTDYYSFITQQPCRLAYEALEACELLMISRAEVNRLFDKFKSIERFGRLLAEQNFLGILGTQMNLKSVSPEEKYLTLMKERPKVMQRVPLHMIASYLGMSPEHLSRIRKKVSEK